MTTRTRTRTFRDTTAQAAAVAHVQKQSSTCEGCGHLRTLRPMCLAEGSPNYRKPRETFNERCGWYAVKGREVVKA